tara:strand:- start:99 stop:287 length:189 start_codon:yes stop_codon:yes gene_type:complete
MTTVQLTTKIKELCSSVIDSDFEPANMSGTGKIEIWDNGDGVPYIGRWTHEDTQPTAEQLAG